MGTKDKKQKKEKDRWSPKFVLVYTDLQKLSVLVHRQLSAYRKNKQERKSAEKSVRETAGRDLRIINSKTQLLAAEFAVWNDRYRKLNKEHMKAGSPVLSSDAQRGRDQIVSMITDLADSIREAQQS